MDCNAGAAIGQSLFHSAGAHPMMGGPMHHDGMMDEGDQLMGGGGQEFGHMDQWASDFHSVGMMPPAAVMAGHHEEMQMMAAAHHEAEMMEAAFANATLAEQQQHQHAAVHDDHQQAMEDAFHGDDWLEQFHHNAPATEGEQWADDYASEEVQVFTVEGEPLRTVEEKTQDSQFHAFMGKVRTQEVVIDEENGQIVPGPGPSAAGEWEAEFAAQQQRGLADEADDWAAEGADAEGVTMEQAWNDQEGQEEANLRAAWGSDDGEDHMYEDFANHDFNEDPGEEWFKEYETMQGNFRNAQDSTDYPFEPNNPYLFHEDPYMEGFALQQAGNLAEAVLAFEAACQKDLAHQEAWKTLGVTQAENEKDTMAIRALNKARELNPKDVEVHAALAVSHTNESNHAQALRALKEWLLAQPAYETLGAVALHDDAAMAPKEDDFVNQFLFVSPSEHRDCETLFQAAIQLNPTDAELHSSLGVLKNLSHEYDEAAMHFNNALQHRPGDAKLWNKLGATLANGNRSQEALAAYDKALDFNPGYVRAHYNLGIAHSNLGQHNLAAKQLLRAIVLQQGGVQTAAAGGGGAGSGSSTREMWDVLRMTLNLMDRSDLVDLTWKQDVMPFLSEFGLEDLA